MDENLTFSKREVRLVIVALEDTRDHILSEGLVSHGLSQELWDRAKETESLANRFRRLLPAFRKETKC